MIRYFWLPILALLLTINIRASAQDAQDAQEANPGKPDPGATLLAARNAASKQAGHLRKQAEALLQQKDIEHALPLLLQALEVHPEDASVRVLLADIYAMQNKPEAVLQVLRPLIFPHPNGMGGEITTPMKYVLALLDLRKWEEAVGVYEKSIVVYEKSLEEPLRWNIRGYDAVPGSKKHTLPDVHFSPDIFDEPNLRAQAHLILGSRHPQWGLALLSADYGDTYMLDHLKQALKNNRSSLDAQFLIAIVLGAMSRFTEAKTAFAGVMKNATREARPEIQAALAYYTQREQNYKTFAAQQAQRQAEQKAQEQVKTAP